MLRHITQMGDDALRCESGDRPAHRISCLSHKIRYLPVAYNCVKGTREAFVAHTVVRTSAFVGGVVAAFLAGSRAGRACIEIPGPNPATSVLTALAAEPSPQGVARALERCGGLGVSRFDCVPRVGWVLLTYSRMSAAHRALVLAALKLSAESESPKVRAVAGEFAACIASGAGCSKVADYHPLDPLEWYRSIGVRASEGPPTRTERRALSLYAFNGRLLMYLDGLLPKGRFARIDATLRALGAENCDDLLAGRTDIVCHDLGLSQIKFGCLDLLRSALSSAPPEAAMIGLVTELDQPVFERACAFLSRADCCGCGAGPLGGLLSRWHARHPTELEAWRDIEEAFRPDGGYTIVHPIKALEPVPLAPVRTYPPPPRS
jgi:hypothetical protein